MVLQKFTFPLEAMRYINCYNPRIKVLKEDLAECNDCGGTIVGGMQILEFEQCIGESSKKETVCTCGSCGKVILYGLENITEELSE